MNQDMQVEEAARDIVQRGRLGDGGQSGVAHRELGATPIVTVILSIILRRRWILISAIIVAVLVGILVTALMTPMYTASTTIDIRRESANLVDVKDDSSAGIAATDQEFYETQYGLLRSRALAERIVEELRLHDSARFFAAFDAGEEWFVDGSVAPNRSRRVDRAAAAAGLLMEHMSLDYERSSRLVELEFSSSDPALSKEIADEWARQFIQFTFDQRLEASAFAREFLEERLDELRGRIDESERRVVDYASRENLVNLPATSGTSENPQPERSLTSDNLSTYNQELAQATAARIEAQSRLRSQAGSSSSEAVNNPTLSALRRERAQASAEYAGLMATFAPTYPPAQAVNDTIRELDREIAREEARVAEALRQNVQSAQQRETSLRQQTQVAANKVLDNRRRSIQYNIYQRDADTNRQLYEALLQRYKEIGVAGGVGENNVSIVDLAQVPGSPSSPILAINLLLSLVAGILLGAVIAWIVEQLNQGIIDPSEVERLFGVPLLGTIPTLSDNEEVEAELRDNKSIISEAYTSVQTTLSFSTDQGVPKTLAVTSTRAAEGKSTTSLGLALSLARSGRRTLLVDADMRSPSVHEELGIDNKAGLSNYLSGKSELTKLVRPAMADGLDALTAGPVPPNTPNLLSSSRFEKLIEDALELYDHVIFDSPPVMQLADGPIIASRVAATIYVLEAHGTQKTMSQIAMNRLVDAKARLLGVVLTKFDTRKANFGYGYDYGYGYGYGKSSDEQAATA